LDLLIGLVIATFIIAAVFVGYHASQEPREEIAEGHGEIIELNTLNNQVMQTAQVLHIKADQSKEPYNF
jgi:hypothetical protein